MEPRLISTEPKPFLSSLSFPPQISLLPLHHQLLTDSTSNQPTHPLSRGPKEKERKRKPPNQGSNTLRCLSCPRMAAQSTLPSLPAPPPSPLLSLPHLRTQLKVKHPTGPRLSRRPRRPRLDALLLSFHPPRHDQTTSNPTPNRPRRDHAPPYMGAAYVPGVGEYDAYLSLSLSLFPFPFPFCIKIKYPA